MNQSPAVRIECHQRRIRGAVTLPGSKSISNRLLVLQEVLGIDLVIHNLSNASDTIILKQALEVIRTTTSATLDIGQAGTDMRFLTALLAAKPGTWVLTGDQRMKQRPVGELVSALRTLGADITYLEQEGYPPLQIVGTKLKGTSVSINAEVSSQFISALLLISPLLKEGLEIQLKGKIVSRPYIRMTLGLLAAFGYRIHEEERKLQVFPRRRKPSVKEFFVESDWSAASYYYSLCALSDNCRLELRHLHKKSLQADSVAAQLFAKLGVNTLFRKTSVLLTQDHQRTSFFDHDFIECPDLAPTLAVACYGLAVPAKLSGLSTLRIKESDRVSVLQKQLAVTGGVAEIQDDSLLLFEARSQKADPVIDTYNDHRIAMSFAPLACRTGRIFIRDHRVVDKSYPAFWEDFASLGFTLTLQP